MQLPVRLWVPAFEGPQTDPQVPEACTHRSLGETAAALGPCLWPVGTDHGRKDWLSGPGRSLAQMGQMSHSKPV